MQSGIREQLKLALEDKLRAYFAVTSREATDTQMFEACALLTREFMSRRLSEKYERSRDDRHVHYLSMEYLIGRSLEKNIFNLGIMEEMCGALEDLGREPAEIFESEPDAGLGNGGLGRLAACYMDSIATLQIPARGYSICYELGIFRQKIEDGRQTEMADNWLDLGENWLVKKHTDAVEVRFGGRVEQHWDYEGNYHAEHVGYTAVLAVPNDMLISGYGLNFVNTLRLWEAKSPNYIDMSLFASGEHVKSMEERTMAEVITKVLYPADDHIEGKTLRLKQQYFFVSATAQSIVNKHRRKQGNVRDFHSRNVIHINDTHPALVIPELMRIFLDEDGLGWDEAWKIVSSCVAYTNHTILSEALETWPQGLIQSLLPRIWEILSEINRRWRIKLLERFGNDMGKIAYNLIIVDGQVKMANLCLAACYKVNGVSALHGEILKNELFRDINILTPERFGYVTNGIDHRRWLAQVNPRLHSLICDLLGSDAYLKRPEELKGLRAFTASDDVLLRLEAIKQSNKDDFARFVQRESGAELMPDSVFDVQVKRLHEYKRQLLCAMNICHLQNQLRNDPGMHFTPRTFLFGAKAASSYLVAKRIIRLILSLARDIDDDPVCRGRLKVMFLENYRVTLAERLMPAAQVSEQISTAGLEASGTGNMKLMMNGAITIGTLDGANVEMHELLGDDNMFLFGLRAHEVTQLKRQGYNPANYTQSDENLRAVMERFSVGFSDGESYSDLVSRLVYGGDDFMLMADFDSYRRTHEELYRTMEDKRRRSEISLVNIAESGIFAADRAVREYADNIWGVPHE